MTKRINTKDKKKIEEIYREIREFCGAEMPFTTEQCEYIKKSLLEAYLLGETAVLREQLAKLKQRSREDKE